MPFLARTPLVVTPDLVFRGGVGCGQVRRSAAARGVSRTAFSPPALVEAVEFCRYTSGESTSQQVGCTTEIMGFFARKSGGCTCMLLAGVFAFACSATAFPQCSGRVLLEEGKTLPGIAGTIEGSATSASPPARAIPSLSVRSSQGSDPVLWVFLIGPAALLLVLLTILVVAVFWLRRKRKRATVSPWKSGMSGHMSGQLQKTFITGVPTFSRSDLEAACEDFSNIIGSSAESVVFKGTLMNGTEIAVNSIRIPSTSWTPNTELHFRRQVEALARMKHQNLVNLIGYCTDEDPFERMLVFEYASNGTLYEHLHNKESEHLDWPMRMRIVMGAAYGMQYMHHELVPATCHLNFDARSVYLSEDYAAKVADFGIAKFPIGNNTASRRKSLNRFIISMGYDDLDSNDRHSPDFEGNVLNFGVFLLETITGRTAYSESEGYLIDWAKEYLDDPKMMWYMVDPSLKSHNYDELVALCETICRCIHPRPSKRPSMREVTWMLSNALHLSPEAASSKVSPLLWAELELLSPVDNSSEETEVVVTS